MFLSRFRGRNQDFVRFAELLVHTTGLPPIRLHDLRHGAASLAHEAGADLKTLQDLLGHALWCIDR
jgi:Site-specific recombinase XerD